MSSQHVNDLTISLEGVSAIRRSATRLARRLRQERPLDSPPLAKLSVLANLGRYGAMSAGRLAELDRVQPQSMTRLLAELAADGLILRERDPEDGRRQRISITDHGTDVLAADMAKRDAWLATALANEFSGDEQRLLLAAADLMYRISELPRSD